MYEFFKNLEIGQIFIIWLTHVPTVYKKTSAKFALCEDQDKYQKFSPDCMVKLFRTTR